MCLRSRGRSHTAGLKGVLVSSNARAWKACSMRFVKNVSCHLNVLESSVCTSYTMIRMLGNLFIVGSTDTDLVKERYIRYSQAADCVPDADGLDRDEPPIVLRGPREAHLLQSEAVLISGPPTLWLVGKGHVRIRVNIILVLPVLHVGEDVVELLHALAREQTNVADQTSDGSSCEGSAREADQDDLVTVPVVGAYEGVRLTDSLRQEFSLLSYSILPASTKGHRTPLGNHRGMYKETTRFTHLS